MQMQCLAFVAGLDMVASHGWLSNPISRNELVCKEKYGDNLMGNAFTCASDRETPAQSPWFSGLPEGVPAGDMPGVAKVYDPVCSGGNDERIPEAIDGLNVRGPSQATWHSGSVVSLCWSVQAAHGGVFGYRLCCDGTNSEQCFQSHPLLTEDGRQWINMTSEVPVTTDWCTKHRVPDGVQGSCTVSWRWDGGCTQCASGQTSESSVFVSCADVTVESSSPTPMPSPVPVPSPKPVNPQCGYSPCTDDEVCCCNGDKGVFYCVAADADVGACAGSTRCPTKESCCASEFGFLSIV
jgi:hypothetical protein